MENGYSSTARGWLVANGRRLALAQVGPDHCILRDAVVLPPGEADLIVQIDGQQHHSRVMLGEGAPADSRTVKFTTR